MSRRIVYVAVALAAIWVVPTDAAVVDSLGGTGFGVIDQPPLASLPGQLAAGMVITLIVLSAGRALRRSH